MTIVITFTLYGGVNLICSVYIWVNSYVVYIAILLLMGKPMTMCNVNMLLSGCHMLIVKHYFV